MSLVPKISVIATDPKGKYVTFQDITGVYNVSTNPGGYGAPNFDTTDLDWAVMYFRNYNDEEYTIQKLTPLTGILGSGQNFAGLTEGVFDDGVWEAKYYPVVAHPVTPNVDTTITWTIGSKTFNLSGASTLLAGVAAILIKDISDTKLYFIESVDTNTATVTEQLPSTGTGLVALAYEADTRFLITNAADNCIATKTGLIIKECSCFDPEMQQIFLMMGKRQGVDVLFSSKQNYQAAHDIITQLGSYCDNTSKCGC